MTSDRELLSTTRYEWERIVRRVQMKAPTKLVAFACATYANRDGTSVHPGVARLTAVTCLSDKTVRNGLHWLRDNGLLRLDQEGSRNGRRGLADAYSLTLPSDLLTSLDLLDPDESPVPPTGDRADVEPEHRYLVPGTPVAEDGTPVAGSRNTGTSYRTQTHDHPGNQHTYQRDDHFEDVTTDRASSDLVGANVIHGRFGVAK